MDDPVSEAQRIVKEEDILEIIKQQVQKKIANEDIPIQIILLSIFSALLLNEPFGVLLYSASSAGKSAILHAILDCLSERFDAVKTDENNNIIITPGFGYVSFHNPTLASITRATRNNPRAFEGKILILHELPEDSSEEMGQIYHALRQYVSEGYYDRWITDEKSKNPIRLRLEGYCACISESAEQPIEIQWGNRFIFVNMDESIEQNRAIAEFQALKYYEPWNVQEPDVELIRWILEVFLSPEEETYWKHVSVHNIWVYDLVEIIQRDYGKDVRVRRYQNLLFRAVETTTRLHYQQRERVIHKSGLPLLLSSKWDNAKCLYLFEQMLAHTFKSLTSGAVQLLYTIRDTFCSEEWRTPELIQKSGMSKSSVHNKIKMLRDYGLIEFVGKKSRAHIYRLSEKGKNSKLIVPHRSMNDYMTLLSDRKYREDPVYDRSSFFQEVLPEPSKGDFPGMLDDTSISEMKDVECSDSEVIVQRTIKDNKKEPPKFWEKAILQIVKEAEKEILRDNVLKQATKRLRLGVGYHNRLNEIIDRLLNSGKLFEPKKDHLQKI